MWKQANGMDYKTTKVKRKLPKEIFVKAIKDLVKAVLIIIFRSKEKSILNKCNCKEAK